MERAEGLSKDAQRSWCVLTIITKVKRAVTKTLEELLIQENLTLHKRIVLETVLALKSHNQKEKMTKMESFHHVELSVYWS